MAFEITAKKGSEKMKPVSFTFPSSDGVKIHVNKWMSGPKAKGIVQIAHGMAEHSGRYADFAAVLTEAGYHVYANDHRGLGKSAGSCEVLGHFADENGWELAVDDMYRLTKLIKDEVPNLPLFLFGHSMGSFLSRTYVQQHGEELAGLILSGTGAGRRVMSSLGILIAKIECRLRGKRARSVLMNTLSFGNFNKPFRPARTPFDWLSRDPQEVDKYVQDPLCGEVPTANFFCDLLTGIKQMDEAEGLARIPNELSIFLLSGDKDPVGQNGKGVRKTYQQFKQIGIKDVVLKLYPDGRHEMLNETNKEEVYRDILAWLDTRVARTSGHSEM